MDAEANQPNRHEAALRINGLRKNGGPQEKLMAGGVKQRNI